MTSNRELLKESIEKVFSFTRKAKLLELYESGELHKTILDRMSVEYTKGYLKGREDERRENDKR